MLHIKKGKNTSSYSERLLFKDFNIVGHHDLLNWDIFFFTNLRLTDISMIHIKFGQNQSSLYEMSKIFMIIIIHPACL